MPQSLRLLLPALLLTAPVARAQGTPEEAAVRMSAAQTQGDWAGAARMMHPASLRQLRDLFSPLMASQGGAVVATRLFGLTSAAEFAATPDTVLFARLMKSVIESEAMLKQALSSTVVTPLGHVRGGGDTVFVVTRQRMTVETIEITTFPVMPFLKEGDRWWGLLTADLTNIAAMLKRTLGGRES
ncbi:MAG: hypothetical protein IPK12_01235 [Gemmatimonadetes bacterium]|nr:hypothetical protein [Gemmatimonadota bacterium]